MPLFRRYALFYAPPADSPLAAFGAGWLGWDAQNATRVEDHSFSRLAPAGIQDLVTPARKYGFHGTLRPPFVPKESIGRAEIAEAARTIARQITGFEVPKLSLRQLGNFVALTPDRPSPQLAALAKACIVGTNPLRSALSDADLARRRGTGLSPTQEALLQKWGYPHVMEEFRFHLTLTGKLSDQDAATVIAALTPHLTPILATAMEVREICLFGEAGDGFFHIIDRFPLADAKRL